MGRMSKNPVIGIYLITCTKNNKKYIGGSTDIKFRFTEHKRRLKGKTHKNKYLENDWQEFGRDFFTFGILEYCLKYELLEREHYWMLQHDVFNPEKGYNIISHLDPKLSRPRKNSSNIIPEERRKKGILLKQGEELKLVSSKLACEIVSCKSRALEKTQSYWASNGEKGSRTYKGYIYLKQVDYDSNFNYWNWVKPKKPRPPRAKKEVIKKGPKPYAERNLHRKPIKMVHALTGEEICFPSALQATKSLNLVKSKVHFCLKSDRGNTHRGYKFYYV